MCTRCSCFTTSISFRVFWRSVQLSGVREWLCVLEVVPILMVCLVLSSYRLLCWGLGHQMNLRKLYCMKWFMLFCLLLILELVCIKGGMVRNSKKLCRESTRLLGLILLYIIVLMIRSIWCESMFGGVTDLARIDLLSMVMLEEPWIEGHNQRIIGLLNTRELVVEILLKLVVHLK